VTIRVPGGEDRRSDLPVKDIFDHETCAAVQSAIDHSGPPFQRVAQQERPSSRQLQVSERGRRLTMF
jgi:hypothetical protein